MKKLMWVLLTTFSLAVAGSAGALEKGKLLIWIGGDKGYRGLQQVADKFSKDLGVAATVEYPEDVTNKFQQAAAVSKGPDVFIWAHDRSGEWMQAGLLSPVQPSAEIKDSISDLGWQAFTIDGRLWGYPIAYESVSLIYNKELVAEPPKSFAEFIELDKQLSSKGKKAILWDYTNTYFTWPLLAANGGYAFGKDAKGNYNPKDTGVNNPGSIEGVQTLMKLIDAGVMPRGATYSNMETSFNKGDLAAMISGPWAWGNLKKSGIKFGVATIPAVGKAPGKPFVGVLGAMINQASPNKDLAVEFLEQYLLQPEGLKMIDADVPLGVPANQAFYEELAAQDPNIKATMANVELGSPMPTLPEMARFWSAMKSALENITQGRQGVKEALDAAAKRITQ